MAWATPVPGWAGAGAEEPPTRGLGLREAVELLLANDPNISLVETDLQAAEGELVRAAGRFDPVVSSGLERGDAKIPQSATSVQRTETLVSRIGLDRELRTGLSLEPSLEMTQTAAPGSPASNLGTLTFTLRQPLLRDRGRRAVGAEELAADRERTAAVFDLRHRVSERVLALASRYWEAVSARLDLDTLEASEAAARDLLATTRRLVSADVIPAADLVLLEADLAAKESDRIGGERQLYRALLLLAREIGLPPERIGALPPPSDPLPALGPEDTPDRSAAARFVGQALARRADLLAARERLAGTKIRLAAADNALRPRLDLLLSPSYSGWVGGNDAGGLLTSPLRNLAGLSSTVALALSWPAGNHQARGELLTRRAEEGRGALLVEQVVRTIGADVPTAVDAVATSAQQVRRARRAVELFAQAVGNEEKKLRAGTSTLIDVITQKDRLTASRLTETAARLALALALADLRFQTGTLLEPDGESTVLRFDHVATLPFPETAPQPDEVPP